MCVCVSDSWRGGGGVVQSCRILNVMADSSMAINMGEGWDGGMGVRGRWGSVLIGGPGSKETGSGSVWSPALSVAAASTVPAPVGVARRLPVLGPLAQDLIGAVVAAATGHAGRGVVDLEL